MGFAVERLQAELGAKGITVVVEGGQRVADQSGGTILIAGAASRDAQRVLERLRIALPQVPEALCLAPATSEPGGLVSAVANDERGLAYAVHELADRVCGTRLPADALHLDAPIIERPANEVRSVARLFVSEPDDKPWFYDRDLWRRYLSMLIAQRFNRVNLMVGLGYNFPWHITDSYFYFAYPFLVDVPGSGVHIPQLPDDERRRNLETLRFISDEAIAHGLDFQLGLWTHAYEWFDSQRATYTIEGLTPERHAEYCGAALQALLEACPAISGLTIRTHGESGVAERSWDFWRVVLDAPGRSGRQVRLDLHAKGLDQETIDIALQTGMPITISPKYAAEHMGLPYHQAAIRESDRVTRWHDGQPLSHKDRFMRTSEGSRPFTRYGYGDFLREDRRYKVVFRIWPGTQRVLLSGDPAMAAGFGRFSSIAGSNGVEWAEPLSLKSREGSSVGGRRDCYADGSLATVDEWQKFAYTYLLFGRLTYDPDAPPETWRRLLRREYGAAARDAEAALASASRVLPLVTTAHHPSASNNFYWPELYTDVPIVRPEGSPEPHYYDTPAPKRFGTVDPLDPEVFASVAGFVAGLLHGSRSGAYSPLDVAGWLEQLSADASRSLARLQTAFGEKSSDAAQRLIVDVAIQESLGRFFAGKIRAATYFEIADQSGSPLPLQRATAAYGAALAAWAEAGANASGVYASDLTFGPQPYLRGTWNDRLPAMKEDLGRMAALANESPATSESADAETQRLLAAAERTWPHVEVKHNPPTSFRRGAPVPLSIRLTAGGRTVESVRLRYRHLNQAEEYEEIPFAREKGHLSADIPASYTDSPYPLAYFFVLNDGRRSWLYPGLGASLCGQPYFVIRGLDHGGMT